MANPSPYATPEQLMWFSRIGNDPQDFEVLQNNKNEKGWVNLEIKDKRDGGKYIQLQGEMKPKAVGVNDTDDGMPF